MGFFDWAAPMFARFGDRWSPADAEAIAALLRPFVPEAGRLLDLGGGTGALAAHLADAMHCRVTVLDATPKMLSYVPARPDLETVLGRAEAMPLPDGAFDAAVVSDAFHHFRDQDGAASEIQRVVRCGGGVLVLELDPRGPAMRAAVFVERRILGEPGAFLTPDEMCAFWERHGVEGTCAKEHAASYRFLGEVTGG